MPHTDLRLLPDTNSHIHIGSTVKDAHMDWVVPSSIKVAIVAIGKDCCCNMVTDGVIASDNDSNPQP